MLQALMTEPRRLWKETLTDDLMLCRFVSKAGAGSRGGGDRQFCYVNGRPVDLPKVIGATHACHTTSTLPAGHKTSDSSARAYKLNFSQNLS